LLIQGVWLQCQGRNTTLLLPDPHLSFLNCLLLLHFPLLVSSGSSVALCIHSIRQLHVALWRPIRIILTVLWRRMPLLVACCAVSCQLLFVRFFL
jgi:hypothetical protein